MAATSGDIKNMGAREGLETLSSVSLPHLRTLGGDGIRRLRCMLFSVSLSLFLALNYTVVLSTWVELEICVRSLDLLPSLTVNVSSQRSHSPSRFRRRSFSPISASVSSHSKPALCLFPCRLILVHVFCFCQRLPLFLSSFSDIVAPRFLHWMILELCLPWVLVSDLVSVCASFPCRSDRFRLVIAACASSLATNILILLRYSPHEQFVMWVCYSYLNQRDLSHLEVDRIFGRPLLGLCALVASSVLSRIVLVQVVLAVPSAVSVHVHIWRQLANPDVDNLSRKQWRRYHRFHEEHVYIDDYEPSKNEGSDEDYTPSPL
ncbi:hypothetical protein DY000_02026938 [Brassica cretica]|uniref:Uncharacterized protein n=1 Tax=Brassica cretica TaxID=69181 RepID=A0ABQ7EDL3_BRACR|nr:hypothetical protein DY000_02026938 [Brassica cretica]